MSDLEAGPELDALVAEKVMGLKLFTATEKRSAIVGGSRVMWGTWVTTGEKHEWGPVVVHVLPYSTDIAAAWTVVEKLSDRDFEISRLDEGDPSVWWNARFDESYGEEKSAALAICRAALKAVLASGLRPVQP